MKNKYSKINYRVVTTTLGVILLVVIIGASLLAAKTPLKKDITLHVYRKNKTKVSPPDSVCNIKKLWALTPGHTDTKKYFEIAGADQVTFSGKVIRAGVDGTGTDCDSTFEFIVDKSERARVQSYFKQAASYKLLDSVIHCEIICSCPSCNKIYAACNCTKPAMPHKGDYVQVTGKLIVDLHHVAVFRNFELHPVESIQVISGK